MQQTYGQATSENYYLFLVNNRPKQCVPGHGHAMSMYETKKRTRTLDIGNINYSNYMAGVEQTCQVSRITRESRGFWQFLKAHGRETQCSRIFVNLTECCDQGINKFCTRTRL